MQSLAIDRTTRIVTVAIKRYEIRERIGAGGMAEVFRAVAFTADGEIPVVVKKILPEFSKDADFRRMFMDEATITARLEHPNIVRLLDLGRMDDQLFIALEYVDGSDVEKMLLRARELSTRITMSEAVHIVIEALKGLHHAHSRTRSDGKPLGIVHRDVSPSNVMVSATGAVKVTDFGIAKAADRAGKTQVGVIKGNLKYMSPEQLAGRAVDARTDVYSAGLVLHVLLTGEHPFDWETLPDLIDKTLRGDLPRPSTVNQEVPDELDAIIHRATVRLPEERFTTALEFQEALEVFASRRLVPIREVDLARLLAGHREGQTPPGSVSGTFDSIVARIAPLISEVAADGSFHTTSGLRRLAVRPDSGHEETTTEKTFRPVSTVPQPPRRPKPSLVRGVPTRLEGHRHPIASTAIGPDGRAYSAGHDQLIKSWDVETLAEIRSMRGHRGAITSLSLAADGDLLLSGSRDKTLRLWRVREGREVLSIADAHEGWVFSAEISRDGRTAISGGVDGRVKLWDLSTSKAILSMAGHTDAVSSVCFMPDGQRALSAGYDQKLRLWSLLDGSELQVMGGKVGAVRAVAVSSDGATALSAGADHFVRVWDLASGGEAVRLEGHEGPVIAVCFLPGGRRALSGSYDGTIRVWDVLGGFEVAKLSGHQGAVMTLACATDGSWFLSGSDDCSAAIWDLDES